MDNRFSSAELKELLLICICMHCIRACTNQVRCSWELEATIVGNMPSAGPCLLEWDQDLLSGEFGRSSYGIVWLWKGEPPAHPNALLQSVLLGDMKFGSLNPSSLAVGDISVRASSSSTISCPSAFPLINASLIARLQEGKLMRQQGLARYRR